MPERTEGDKVHIKHGLDWFGKGLKFFPKKIKKVLCSKKKGFIFAPA
tara:strand:- start:267 stop:407 length:141 start_codon:yes stop_codon:yes gene_type:complete